MDYNNDGKNDLLAGDSAGNVWIFINNGSKKAPELAAGKKVEADGKAITASRRKYKKEGGRRVPDGITLGSHELAQIYSKVHMADWDGDGLKDLLVGHDTNIIFYKNQGTKTAPKFAAPAKIPTKRGQFPRRPSPYVVDWDGDGVNDLLVGSDAAKVYFYRNTGSNTKPQLATSDILDLKGDGFNGCYRCRIEVTDWNNDGKKDVLVGNYSSSQKDGKRYSGGNIWLFLGK
ncbi:FG-GAP repeat domain-containing protein [Planctomycetota bacterium]